MDILEVKNLTISFQGKKAVDDVTFSLKPGEIVGLVGESGCGKSLTAFSILGINPPESVSSGDVFFKNENLMKMDFEAKRKIRGNKISLIPQDPLSALNPVYTIGEQIIEILEVHKGMSREMAMIEAIKTLESVNIPNAKQRLHDYPHQFSGGMRQRVLIAMGLVAGPDILIADEPTTALDVTIQLQILEIIKELKNKGKAILFITHDLAVVSELCDKVYVMYLGKIVEAASTKEIFSNPKHPYTQGLLNSLPDESKKRLEQILGQPPSINSIPPGCSFHPRCSQIMDKCKTDIPDLYNAGKDHLSRCFLEDVACD